MSATRLTPLAIPDGLSRPASIIERIARWVPVLGWIVAKEFENRRNYPVLESLFKQLESRTGEQLDNENKDPEFGDYQKLVARVVRDTFEWPNDYFISDDPFELMLFDDDGSGVEVFWAMEVSFKILQRIHSRLKK